MFNKARNVKVTDSLFTLIQTVDASKQGKLDRLLEEVAPNAILNAGGRADEVRCYPGTREEVIGKVEKWMDGEGKPYRRMMWLSGPAGAGKSAIVQTVTERCQMRGIHAANFFFFRGDGTRNHAQPLVATLVYQLLRFYPVLYDLLSDSLTATPLAYKASTEEQFMQLISAPIRMVQHSASIHVPIIIIVDGLDECADERKQEQILKALYALVEENASPFRVLVASRAESHLVMSFNKIGTSVKSIFLDNEYRPQDDIRRFVIAKFNEIKSVHSLARTLDKHWPENNDIDAITNKSSGQFIYAATVMRFIEYSTASPALSLLRVYGMRPVADHSPFSQLDAVYSYIFSMTSDIQTVKLMLGATFIAKRKPRLLAGMRHPVSRLRVSFQDLYQHGGYNAIDLESLLADLAPVVRLDPGPPMEIVFYHASLSDYLRDKSRSGIYYVDVESFTAEWASICLKKMDNLDSWKFSPHILQCVGIATPDLSASLLDASKQKLPAAKGPESRMYGRWWILLMIYIYQLYFFTDRGLFNRMLRFWIRFAYIHNIRMPPTVIGTFYHRGMTRRIFTHYNWYLLTEGVKSALRPRT